MKLLMAYVKNNLEGISLENTKENCQGGCGTHQHGEGCTGHSQTHECQHTGGGKGLCRAPVEDTLEALLAQKARLEAKLTEVEKRLQAL